MASRPPPCRALPGLPARPGALAPHIAPIAVVDPRVPLTQRQPHDDTELAAPVALRLALRPPPAPALQRGTPHRDRVLSPALPYPIPVTLETPVAS